MTIPKELYISVLALKHSFLLLWFLYIPVQTWNKVPELIRYELMNMTVKEKRLELGTMMCAARHVYGWSELHQAYVRITARGPPYRVGLENKYRILVDAPTP